MADLSTKITEARKAGYSDDEITSYLGSDSTLAPKIATAKQAGYSSADILGHLSSSGAPAKPAPRPTLAQEANGFMATLNRGLLIGDELTAGAHTVGNVLSGKVPLRGAVDDFKSELGKQNALADDFEARRPIVASAGAKGIANSALLAVPGGNVLKGSLPMNMARGALVGSAMGEATGLLDRGSVKERLEAGKRNALNPVTLGLGAAAGALAPRAEPTRKQPAAKAPTDGDVLADIGVSTSIPQRMGRSAKSLEDIAKRFPIVGQAIGGYNDRQIGQLNRGVGLMAVEPIGGTIPKEIKPGFEMVDYIDGQLGKVYDQAAKLVPKATIDAPFMADLDRIGARKADLAEGTARQFDSIVKDRLTRLADDSSGAMVKEIHGELGALQSEAARKGETTLASMLGDTRKALMGIVERGSPEAKRLIQKADKGWQIYSILNDAAAAASNRGGVFLPGQLNTQVRSAGKAMGSNMVGKGKAPLQAIATAASRTIPDTFGNPGTANATLAGSGIVGMATAPVQTAAVGAGLTAAATPYFLAGRKVIESLPANAGAAEVRAAQSQLAKLAIQDPAVAKLQQELSVRLSRLGALSGTGRERPRNALATPN